MTRLDDQVASAQREVREHRRWIEEHGGTREGYALRYGRASDSDHLGDGSEAIYAADLAALARAQDTLALLTGVPWR